MQLREWMVLHVRHRDAFARKLSEVREEADRVVFSYKDGDVFGYAYEQLRVPPAGRALVVTLQRKENVDELIRNWELYAKNPELTIIFVNPARNEKWSIKPALHAKIAEDNVEPGIRAMAAEITHV